MTRPSKARRSTKPDTSPYSRAGRGVMAPVNSNSRDAARGVPNFSRKPQPQRTMQQPDDIDELASALLDDSSMEHPYGLTKPQHSLAAMVQHNITAFATNRMPASPPSRLRAQKLLDVSVTAVPSGNINRRSVGGPLTEKPVDDNIVRRSKTLHPSRKAGLSKQKSVLKKMTGALTDRLHLTLKNADSETHVDTAMEYATVKGMIQLDRTQMREHSTRNRVIKNESPKKKAQPQPVLIEPRDRRFPRRSSSLIDDPFLIKDCGTELPNDFLVRLRASSTTEASSCTTNRSTTESLVSLMKGNLGSLSRGNPTATSSPRVHITLPPGKALIQKTRCEPSVVASICPISSRCSLSPETSNDQIDQEQVDEEEKDETSANTNNVSPVCGYRYPTGGPVAAARASDRKKHPSPSKDDLAILAYKFTVLRESKREEAQRQASPVEQQPRDAATSD